MLMRKMRNKKISLIFRGKKINLGLKVCNSFEKFTGLMFTSKEKANALLFDFKNPTRIGIHSWFVFFPFIAIWLNESGKVIEIRRVSPFTSLVKPERKFTKLIEIPINVKYNGVVKLLDGV